MTKLFKWQKEFLEDISKMSNPELLDATLLLAGGDDYDGCMTDRGEWEFAQLTTTLDERLAKSGFYTQEQYRDILDRETEPYNEGVDHYLKQHLQHDKKPIYINKYDALTESVAHRQFKLGWDEIAANYSR